MTLTPLDIHNKEFSRSFRGYNEDEVNEFLDQVIKDFEFLTRMNKELESQLAEYQDRLNHYVNVEESLNKSIMFAQEAAEEVKLNSKKEAQLIIKEAEKNADRIINEALMRSREISHEVDHMKKQAIIYRSRFKSLVETQLEMLTDENWRAFGLEIIAEKPDDY